MMMLVYICFLLFVCFTQIIAEDCPNDGKVLFCYYQSWAIYRPGIGKFGTGNIDPHLCTHLVYSFAGLDMNTLITSLDPQNDIVNGGYLSFTNLKEKNPCLKTLLAIGGWNEGSIKYSVMVSTEKSREAFVENTLRFLVAYGFDGLDFDWEYPTERGGILEDKTNFGLLLKLLDERLSKWGLLLTIAVPLSTTLVARAYDTEMIKAHVDYVLIMGYDYTAVTSKVTGLLSPMTPIKDTINTWLRDIPSDMIVLGVPAYGRTFNLSDTTQTGVGAPTEGIGRAGIYTQEGGFLSYYEVLQKLASGRYSPLRFKDMNYYTHFETEWLCFENNETYQSKAQYVINENLAGMMVWSIDTDDFDGIFSTQDFPVARSIRKILFGKA